MIGVFVGDQLFLERFIWFDNEVRHSRYPNATNLADQFETSTKTAHRSIDYFRDRLLAAQRRVVMSLPLKWEFPGGKIGPGESAQACLQRELVEERGVDIRVGDSLPPATHHYDTFSVTLHPFRCVITAGEIVLHEHAAICWLEPVKFPTIDWAEADLPVIEHYLRLRNCDEKNGDPGHSLGRVSEYAGQKSSGGTS